MKKMIMVTFCILLCLCMGCGREEMQSSVPEAAIESEVLEETTTSVSEEIPPEPETVTLTLAVLGYEMEEGVFTEDNFWAESISEFNGSQFAIQIETKMYQKDDTQLRMELISGEGPDLISTGAFNNAQVLTAMGALVDLYPYLDNDSELSREDFLNLELLELDGKLTQVTPKYYITSYYGTQMAYGEESGWSFEECLDRITSADTPQDILGNATGSSFIANFIADYASGHVYYEDAECSFDTEEFRAILEVAKAINMESEDPNVYATQTQTQQEFFEVYPNVIYPCRISGVSEFTTFLNTNAGIPVNIIGMPCQEGNGAKAAFPQPISVCTFTKSPEACWEFIRFFLTNESIGEDTNYFPVYIPLLEKQIEEAIVDKVVRNQENPQSIMAAAALGSSVTPKFTEEEAEMLRELLYGGPTLYGYNPVITPIVLEEVETYLSGDKSMDDVIRLIESRVRIYLSEIRS